MKISFFCEAEEMNTNIGIAKAMTESGLTGKDLREIAEYLLIYSDHNKPKGGEEE